MNNSASVYYEKDKPKIIGKAKIIDNGIIIEITDLDIVELLKFDTKHLSIESEK